MSGTSAVFNPGAGIWPEMRTGDVDTRSKSFAADLAQLGGGVTITAVSAVNITRLDGATMTVNDLAVARTPIVNTAVLTGSGGATYPVSTVVTVWFDAGTVGGDYNVEIVVDRSDTGVIGRDTVMTVATAVG